MRCDARKLTLHDSNTAMTAASPITSMTVNSIGRRGKLRHTYAVLALASALVLASCAPYASVSSVSPRFRPAASTSATLAAEQAIIKALRQEQREPLVALGEFLAAAKDAQQQLARDPADMAARNAYNFAVARVIGTVQQVRPDPWTHPLRVPAADGDFVLTHAPGGDPQRDPSRYDLTPADQFHISGTYVREHQRKEGVGAPVVAIERGTSLHSRHDFLMPKLYYGVTALIRFEGRRALVAFEDPLATECVTLAGHTYPLAADFTMPAAVLLAQQNPRKVEIDSLLRAEKYADTTRVARTQPYDPKKTVVLIIHGLMDTPATWVPMFNRLVADEQLRHNYQLWFYSYPTGYPYPYSAALLRRELDTIRRRYPQHHKMVVIGHSMGGCISRLLITDTGETLWHELFKKSPDETELPADSKALLREVLVFRHRPEIGRVIFIAAPLRGSELARNWIGRISSTLVEIPRPLLRVGADALRFVTFQGNEMRMKRAPNSVDSLAPDDRLTLAIQKIPITPGIPHHVICGDRGKAGNVDKTKPVMTDGVVPYWSSHMDTAESELIVPSGHNAHHNPQAIAEVERILKLHLRQ
jgi:pimeloyl-ACP methyl ester carboxylesterase